MSISMHPLKLWPFLACLLCLFGAADAYGHSHHHHHHHGGGQSAAAHGTPGDFAYYALVLSWSPTFCEGYHRYSGSECAAGQTHGFVLHGLWPQYDEGWPLDCHTAERPWVPQSVIDEMHDIMPNKQLVIHEYRTHGTCSGLDPTAFFAEARTLFQKIVIPTPLQAPASESDTSPKAIEDEFLAANDWLKPNMMAVSCRGSDLLDVRFCFGKDGTPTACGANENQDHLCHRPDIEVPPAVHN
jgi:ribonuclease T2